MDTPVAAWSMHGTEFSVIVASDGATRIEVTSGVVQAQVGQQQEVKPGQAIDVEYPNKPPAARQTSTRYLPPNLTVTPSPTAA